MTDRLPAPSPPDECPFCGSAYDVRGMDFLEVGGRAEDVGPETPRGAAPPDEAPAGGSPPTAAGEIGTRIAFDPWKGRLWAVCTTCRRWTPFPLETRWEVLEGCEEAVRNRGSVRLESEHLSLISVEEREIVRVGRPLRIEFAGWRYGERLPAPGRPRGFWSRLLGSLLRLPDPPPGGYDPYGLGVIKDGTLEQAWFASPFLEHASRLTYAFGQVPLAPRCPSCHGPVLLLPWHFQRVRWERSAGERGVAVHCGRCRTEVFLPRAEARPALRLGLALVTPEARARPVAESAAVGVEEGGGASGYLDALASDRRELGDLDVEERVALAMVLDEEAELEALEAEWRRAEEITAIMDGELTRVPGFEAFRRRVLEEGG